MINPTSSLTSITLNCQGLRNPTQRSVLFSWLSCFSPTIACLQETHSTSQAEFEKWLDAETKQDNNKTKYKVLSSPGTTRSRGVAVLYHPSLTVLSSSADSQGRLQVIHFSLHSTSFQLVNVYGPNQKNPGIEFFHSILPLLDVSLPTIIGGDFNTVVDPHLDRKGCNPTSPWAYNWPHTLATLTQDLNLVDIWRSRHPHERSYTWSRANGQVGSRLDMFWLSSSMVPNVNEISILPYFNSDHSYVYLSFSLPDAPERGRGCWKFNKTLLNNASYIKLINDFWTEWKQEQLHYPSLPVWWDVGKALIRQMTIDFATDIASRQKETYDTLRIHLHSLASRRDAGDDVADQIKNVEEALYEHHRRKAAGARLRAREQWAEEGEISSKYFFQREKTHAVRNVMLAINDGLGRTVRTLRGILHVWMLFYTALFSAAYLDAAEQAFFLGKLTTKLSSMEAALCEGAVTLEECTAALNSFTSNKSPGVDGLTYEFYRAFWTMLGPDLVTVLNAAFREGKLSLSQRTGIITLLYKKGDKLAPKNWRPITLLCSDYKILSKVLTGRLAKVLTSVVSPCQTCGIPGRFSGEVVRLVQDCLDFANSSNIGGALLSLDQEKAFDRVDWNFLQQVLTAMNFGPSFRTWVRLMYTTLYSRILINGALGGPFSISRGVRQGCPLSPLLYVLAAEPISRAIQDATDIDGFPLPSGERVKVLQYADDTTCFVLSDSSLLALLQLFERYAKASGAKLNIDKTEGLLFGPWKSRTNLPIALKWSSDCLIILGCRVGNSILPDWDNLISKFKNKITSWSTRSLSLQGRTLLANTLGLSTFWYQGTIFDMPKVVVHSINKILFPFIWNKSREPIARSSAVAPRLRGGLGVVHVGTKILSLRAIWLRRLLLSQYTIPWHAIFSHHISKVFKQDLDTFFARESTPAYLIKRLPKFYQSMIHTWMQLKGRREGTSWLVRNHNTVPLPLAEVTASKTYSVLLESSLAPHKAIEKFNVMQIDVHWPSVWNSLRLWRHIRSVADTNYYNFHGRLATADRLLTFGMKVDEKCFCGEPETALHLFCHCPVATTIWDWLTPLLMSLALTTPLTISTILFGFSEAKKTPAAVNALLGIFRHHLWLHRNRCRFDRLSPDATSVLRMAKSTFRFAVQMEHRHCLLTKFENEWLLRGVVGTIAGDNSVSFSKTFMS